MRYAQKLISVIFAVTLIVSCGVYASAATDKDKEIKVRRVEIVVDSITVRVNQTRNLYATVFPSDAKYKSIYWDSSDWNIVSVDGDGEITGISPGTAEVRAISGNNKVGRCIVTVPDTAIRSDACIQDIESEDLQEAAINGGEILQTVALRIDTENAVKNAGPGNIAQVIYNDKTIVSTAALRGSAYAAKMHDSSVNLKIRTLNDDGTIQGQLTINPGNAPDVNTDIKISVYTEHKQVTAVLENAKSQFDSNNVAGIYLPQQGDFGMEVQVAAKVVPNVTQMDEVKLYRYVNGAYAEISTEMWMDSNGFLHFSAMQGGAYVLVY